MADVSGVDNLTFNSNGSDSLAGIKSAVDNLNSAKAESSAVVPNTRQVNGHVLAADVTLVKGDVGLGNVDNTSDATKNSAAVTLLNKVINAALNTITNISEAMLALTDVTTWNVSTSAHGFVPKLPNDASKFLDGTGAFSTPTGAVQKIAARQVADSQAAGTGGNTYYFDGLSSALIVPFAGTVKNLFVLSGATTPNAASGVTVQKNGTDTALTVAIPSGSNNTGFSDTTHTASVAAGDTLNLHYSAGVGGSALTVVSAWIAITKP